VVDNSIESGATATSWLLDRDRIPTAIVALSDVLALGALQEVERHGLQIPTDVSVCGFDDVTAAHAANLTTVHQPIREKGQHVGRLLIDPESQPRQVLLPISLITRGTTGPAREELIETCRFNPPARESPHQQAVGPFASRSSCRPRRSLRRDCEDRQDDLVRCW
jgi:ABC-type sugar transport system substrate-binding protein